MQVMSGASAELPKGLHSKVANYRHKVFVEQLGWELQTQDGAERDQFDRPDTVYVVAQDDNGHVSGCARLLPTTRPYLLGEVFPQLLNGLLPPCSPDVWELSRFAAVDLNSAASTQGQFSSPVTIELLKESIACAAALGARFEGIEFSPGEAQRYKERSQAERTNARLKDDYGDRHIRVKGHAKVMAHLMFGILALTVD